MGSLFSSTSNHSTTNNNNKNNISLQDKAIYDIKVQRDRLTKYTLQIEQVINKETLLVKDLLLRNLRDRALLILKKRTYQEKLLANINDQLLNLETMVSSIEFSSIQVKVYDALNQGKITLQNINKEMSIEDVAKLMDDTEEAIEYQKEVGNMLSKELSPVDDATITEELKQLEDQFMKELLQEAPTAPKNHVIESKESEKILIESKKDKTVILA